MRKRLTVEYDEDGCVYTQDGFLLCVSHILVNNSYPYLEQTTGILVETRERRVYQDLKYPDQDHSQDYWALTALHEMGEVSTNLLLQSQGKREVNDKSADEDLRSQWLDVAAVCVAAIENLDRDTLLHEQDA